MNNYQNSPFLEEILQKAKDLCQRSGVNALTRELENAVQLISDHREEVDALVEQLLQNNSLRGEQIEAILSRKA